MNKELSLRSLSDDELLRRLSEILKQSRRTEADLVAHIAEVDARRAFAREAAPSMHAYCTEVLHLSEPETWLRIRVARASRKHPAILEMLRDGRIHLSGVALLAPHLTPKNHRALLRRATHKSKRQVEEIVADLAPRPDAPAVMRKLPTPRSQTSAAPALLLRPDAVEGPLEAVPTDTATQSVPLRSDNLVARGPALRPDAVVDSATPAPRPAKIEPLAPARYKVQFTASKERHDKLQRLQALMRTTVPDGDLATLSSNDSNRGGWARRKRPGRPSPRPTPRRPRATSPPRCGGPSTNATAASAPTWTGVAGAAKPAATWSSTITRHRSAGEGTTRRRTFVSCVAPTTRSRRSGTSGRRRWRGTGGARTQEVASPSRPPSTPRVTWARASVHPSRQPRARGRHREAPPVHDVGRELSGFRRQLVAGSWGQSRPRSPRRS